MRKLILATNNKNKVKEIREILKELKIDIMSLSDLNIDVDIEETGSSFAENSLIKARGIADILKKNNYKNFIVMADDSGLEVPYLGGEPGIFSARYSGVHGDDKGNNNKLLLKLQGIPKSDRKANFRCAIGLIDSNNVEKVIEGTVEGLITEREEGDGGFGYDPLFFYEPLNKTFGELSSEEKNSISHRANALNKLKNEIEELLDKQEE
jgi:XTP/dITP diphosphohydrolase